MMLLYAWFSSTTTTTWSGRGTPLAVTVAAGSTGAAAVPACPARAVAVVAGPAVVVGPCACTAVGRAIPIAADTTNVTAARSRCPGARILIVASFLGVDAARGPLRHRAVTPEGDERACTQMNVVCCQHPDRTSPATAAVAHRYRFRQGRRGCGAT